MQVGGVSDAQWQRWGETLEVFRGQMGRTPHNEVALYRLYQGE
jgi:hypothetical protein